MIHICSNTSKYKINFFFSHKIIYSSLRFGETLKVFLEPKYSKTYLLFDLHYLIVQHNRMMESAQKGRNPILYLASAIF